MTRMEFWNAHIVFIRVIRVIRVIRGRFQSREMGAKKMPRATEVDRGVLDYLIQP
jgi:hypothetical protein